jgi:hypothetical protein
VQFDSSAVSALWNTLISNQSHLCILEFSLSHVEDQEIKAALTKLQDSTKEISNRAHTLYTGAGYPEPNVFLIKNDVNTDAPRLFSDRFYLFYNQIFCGYGLTWYSLCLGKTTDKSMISFLSDCIVRTVNLYTMITELMEIKGFGHLPVYISPPKKPEPAVKPSLLKGIFGGQRTMNATEIDNLIFSLRGAILAKTNFMAFSQTSSDQEIRKLCNKGVKLCRERIEMMQSALSHEDLPYQPTYDAEVSDSTISPFSERLTLYHIMFLVQVALVRYGMAFSLSTRTDLAAMYTELEVETTAYAADCLHLMLEKGWLEHPPSAIDRKKRYDN